MTITRRYDIKSDQERMLERARDGRTIAAHEPIQWRCHAIVHKYVDEANQMKDKLSRMFREWERGSLRPYDIVEWEGNLLMTVGATDLWNGLVTAGLATPYNSTNAALGVGDGNTAAAAGNTDLSAAAGTKLNAADPTSATNATPIVVAATYSPAPTVGSVVVCSAFSGAGAAAINNTFELSAASGSSITLLNSAGSGAITVTGGLVKPINRYWQVVNGAPSVSTNQVQFVGVFASTHANHAWNEFATMNGGAATNLQQAPPSPHQLNRAVPGSSFGSKGSGTSWTLTETVTIS